MADPDNARVALERALQFTVLTLAFLGRDRGTDRQNTALDGITKAAAELDPVLRTALAERATTAAGEPTKLPGREAIKEAVREACDYAAALRLGTRSAIVERAADNLLAQPSQSEPGRDMVLAAAKAAWRADMVDKAEQRGDHIPDTFDFEWGWEQCATMPLSGPGFVRQWTTIALACLAAATPTKAASDG